MSAIDQAEPAYEAPSPPPSPDRGWLSDFAWADGGVIIRKTGIRLSIDRHVISEVLAWAAYLAVLGVVVLLGRLRRRKLGAIWYAPDRPRPWYLLRGAALWAGYGMARTPQEADVACYFDDSTRGAVPDMHGLHSFNARCADVSKSRVAADFEAVFGYPLAIDPTTAQGPIVEKSEKNGVHDGRVVQAPLQPRDGYVYQRLVDTTDDAGLGYDLRTPCVGTAPVVVWVKTKPEAKRFAIHNAKAVLREPSAVFSGSELDRIRQFNARIGLDWGGLDILRDRRDGRLYIVDVNKTDLGPVIALSWADKVRSMNRLAKALTALVRTSISANAKPSAEAVAGPAVRRGYMALAGPACLLAACLALAWFWALHDPRQGLLEAFRHYASACRTFDASHPILALAIFVCAYAGAIVAMLPIALIMTFCSGSIFGAGMGALGSIMGAALGAAIAYGLAAPSGADADARTKLARYDRWLDGLRRSPFRYTLSLRLMPLTPYTLVSMAAGFARVGVLPFLAGSILGVLPECIVYAAIGARLAQGLGQATATGLLGLVHPAFFVALVGLAILALLSARLGKARP